MSGGAPSSGHVPPNNESSEAPPRDADPADANAAAAEADRKRLARALNDGPSQALSNVVLRAEMVERLIDSDPSRARDEAQRLREAAVAALADVRRFMFDTYPSVLEDLGLVSTLRRYFQGRTETGRAAVELRVEGDERRLSLADELALFRAAQAALSQRSLQSGELETTLTLDYGRGSVELRVDADLVPVHRTAAP